VAKRVKVDLPVEKLPREWYNVLADLPFPLDPPLDPKTQQPVNPEALLAIFPRALVEQEMSDQRHIPIPEPILEEYALYRPTPLIRATKLEEYLETPARIYYKYEGVSPTGSHKTNTSIAQAYFNAKEGVEELVTETGAGQWGSALSYAGRKFGIKVRVFMVRISYHQKPMRKYLMNFYDASVEPSPSKLTQSGKGFLSHGEEHPGSLGIAISEAIEYVVNTKNAKYSLGSVLNHVLMHQTCLLYTSPSPRD